MTDVFISYKREERPKAEAIALALARQGYEVWWDAELLPGDNFTQEIRDIISHTKVAIVIWSKRSVVSPYVLDEAALARDRNILIPTRIDDCQIPIGFGGVQILDLSGWNGAPDDPVLEPLVRAVEARATASRSPPNTEEEVFDALDDRSDEARYWKEICEHQPQTSEEYKLYLQRFGDDAIFADIARLRISQLMSDRANQKRWTFRKIHGVLMAIVTLITASVILLIKSEEYFGDDLSSIVKSFFVNKDNIEEFSVIKDCSACPDMTALPTGSFLMGSMTGGGFANEEPQHKVVIGSRFAISRTPVTVAKFSAFIDASGYPTAPGCVIYSDGAWTLDHEADWRTPGFKQDLDHPVVCVSWEDAGAYAAWITKQYRGTNEYRLPSEAEWEYAARAGSVSRFWWGNDTTSVCDYVNGADASTNFAWKADCEDGFRWTSPIGRFPPNQWGLHDTLGNTWEWTADLWHESYEGAPNNGTPWLLGNVDDSSLRATRGGSWFVNSAFLRTTSRLSAPYFGKNSSLGFRLARTLSDR